MELMDSAFPFLGSVKIEEDLHEGFRDVHAAILVGSKPRGKGEERADLLVANGKIFGPQGKALAEAARPDVKVLVVGNPANTNAAIVAAHAKGLAPQQITAMTRLDHNRALAQVAERLDVHVSELSHMIVWGNHSASQFPDVTELRLNGHPVGNKLDEAWLTDEFIPAWPSAVRRSLKSAGILLRPRRPAARWITCAIGSRASIRSGYRWRFLRTVPMGFRKASSAPSLAAW